MVIETVTSPSGMPRKRISMSSSEEIGAPHLPTSPSLMRVVGVVAHQRRQVEGHRKSGLALLQQVVVAAIGLLRRGEAGELPHGPELAAIHVAVDAARVRELARAPEFAPANPPGPYTGSIGTPLMVVNWRSAVFIAAQLPLSYPAAVGAAIKKPAPKKPAKDELAQKVHSPRNDPPVQLQSYRLANGCGCVSGDSTMRFGCRRAHN